MRPSIEVLRLAVSYEPETGNLFWLPRTPDIFPKVKSHSYCDYWNSKHAGRPAFTVPNPDGYLMGMLFNCKYGAHQIAWAITHGEWSTAERQVDHKNRIKTDNRLENLRIVTPKGNIENRVDFTYLPGNERGITFNKACGKWQVSVPIGGGKSKYVGLFECKIAAREARLSALGSNMEKAA